MLGGRFTSEIKFLHSKVSPLSPASIGCWVQVLAPQPACFCLNFSCPGREAPSMHTAHCSMRHCLTLQGPAISKEKDGPAIAGELVKVDHWAGKFTQLSFRLMKCIDTAIWIQDQPFSDKKQTPQTQWVLLIQSQKGGINLPPVEHTFLWPFACGLSLKEQCVLITTLHGVGSSLLAWGQLVILTGSGSSITCNKDSVTCHENGTGTSRSSWERRGYL